MSHILEFLDLVDTPSAYSGGRTVAVNSGADALEFVVGVNADALDGNKLSAASPSDGEALVYDGVTNNRWDAVTPPWLDRTGGTMTGFITLHNVPTSAMHAANKAYIDDNFSANSHGHDDDEIALVGTHTGILSGATYVDDAMTLLDDLEDGDIPTTDTWSGWLTGISSTVKAALDAIDGFDGGVFMRNASGISFREVTGGEPYGWITAITVDNADKIVIGNSGGGHTGIILNSDVDAETHDITTTGEIIAAQGDFPHIRATHSKAVNDGTSTEIARSFLPGSAPKWTSVTVYYEIVAENSLSTHMQLESGLVTLSMIRIGTTNTAATAVKAATTTITTSGTMTCVFSTGTAGVDHQRIRVLANSDFGTPTITGNFTIIGNNDSAITWS